ncbi:MULTISPECIES: hypothetical protein [Burkholderia cepacia complex]|uniref:hypothetical protein n=1 Tax=Burkholderia cepacia complex TaxID=87882 RepID=UPI0013DDDE42|nr:MULTISPECIES: hypothetical protein [Burkholderia cepacia complex]
MQDSHAHALGVFVGAERGCAGAAIGMREYRADCRARDAGCRIVVTDSPASSMACVDGIARSQRIRFSVLIQINESGTFMRIFPVENSHGSVPQPTNFS